MIGKIGKTHVIEEQDHNTSYSLQGHWGGSNPSIFYLLSSQVNREQRCHGGVRFMLSVMHLVPLNLEAEAAF